MKKDIINRLEQIKEKVHSNCFVIITDKNENKQHLNILEAFAFISEHTTNINGIDFIGDVSRQGILPTLLTYLANEKNG